MNTTSRRSGRWRFRVLLGACGTAVAIIGAPLRAQEARTLDFQEAIQIALEQNTTVRQAENALASDASTVKQAKLDFLPDLRLNLNSGTTFGRTFDQNEGAIVDQTTRSLSTGISSSVTLFDGLSGWASFQKATRIYDAGVLELERARQTVVFTVASGFLSLIEAREQLRIQRENLASAQALEAQIDAYVKAGKRTVADLYQQQATVASARYAVVTAERDVALAEMDLVQALQLDPAGAYAFEAPVVDSTVTEARPEELSTLLERAYATRTDFSAQSARQQAAEQGVKVSSASRWPTISLSAGYGSAYSSFGAGTFSDQFDQRRSGSISLGVSIPLFDRGSTSAAVERARITVDDAALALEDARQTIGAQVARAYQDHRSATEQLRAATAGAEAANLALTAARERYEVGAATLLEVTQAHTTSVRAASTLVSARYGLVFQGLLLRYYVGDLDVESVTLG